jgi:ATP-dependent Zn protease
LQKKIKIIFFTAILFLPIHFVITVLVDSDSNIYNSEINKIIEKIKPNKVKIKDKLELETEAKSAEIVNDYNSKDIEKSKVTKYLETNTAKESTNISFYERSLLAKIIFVVLSVFLFVILFLLIYFDDKNSPYNVESKDKLELESEANSAEILVDNKSKEIEKPNANQKLETTASLNPLKNHYKKDI